MLTTSAVLGFFRDKSGKISHFFSSLIVITFELWTFLQQNNSIDWWIGSIQWIELNQSIECGGFFAENNNSRYKRLILWSSRTKIMLILDHLIDNRYIQCQSSNRMNSKKTIHWCFKWMIRSNRNDGSLIGEQQKRKTLSQFWNIHKKIIIIKHNNVRIKQIKILQRLRQW